MLRTQPSFAVICTLTLALGIGATAAVFSLIQGVLLTPPPYEHPGQLVLISAARQDAQKSSSKSWPAQQWMEWRKDVKSFQAVAGYSWTFNFLVKDDGSESMEGMAVSGDYFKALGLKAFMGRTFTEAETSYPTAPVVLIGYDLWQRAFNGDPNIIGKALRMSRRKTPPTIVGVMPRGVRFLPSPSVAEEPNYNVNAQVDFWLPDAPNPKGLKDAYWDVVARLSDGVMPQLAQQELSSHVARQGREDRDFEGLLPKLTTLPDEMNREGRRILLPLLGAAALVLLIACGNAAALLLVRGLQRQQEYAVRSALGVGRLALFRQVATESLLIALVGGALGVGLAFALVKVFTVIGGHAIPRLDAVKTGGPMLAWGMSSAILAALIAGVFPALRASRLDPVSIIKGGGPNSSAGRGERRLMGGVTIIQTAFTLALLVGAGLLIRTMNNISMVRSGFTTSHVLTMSVTAVQGDWFAFHHQVLDRVSAIGGVGAAAFAWGVPLTGNDWRPSLDIEGVPPATKGSDRLRLPLRSVTPGYFALLNLPVIQGRDFRPTDDKKAPLVAIVNQAFVDRYFPNGAAIGKKLWFEH
jgi:putative ABC transport system permease protein